jgi:hypothetical protein
MATKLGNSGLSIFSGVDIVAFKTPLELIEKAGVVFDDEKFSSLFTHESLRLR